MENLILNKSETICKCCGKSIDNLIYHITNNHICSTWTYRNLEETSRQCVDCGRLRYTISPYLNNFYLPCKFCNSEETINNYIIDKLRELEKSVSNDKILISLICSPETLEKSIYYNLDKTRNLIQESYKKKRIPKDSYLCIGFKLGYPKEISERNFEGFGVKEIQVTSKNLVFSIDGNNFKILLPERCSYDLRHHARCSILNPNSTRFTKKIKLEDGSCYKFWNNKNSDVKSIFKILKNDSEIEIDNLSKLELYIIKQIILKNNVTSEILWKIYNEIFRYSKNFRDLTLLRNTVSVFNKAKADTNIIWTPIYNMTDKINISIL